MSARTSASPFTALVAIALITIAMPPSIAKAASAAREQCDKQFSPRSGQAGKDVIWVPTLDELVTAMLTAAQVGPDDYVIDLGSGDGKIPIAAAKQFGARATGVEYNPQMVQLARCYVRAEGLTDKIEIVRGDIFKTNFDDATVLTLYLLSDLNMKLRPRILDLKPGTRVVSNTFKMGDWSPDEFIESEIGNTRAYLWIVPAKVDGAWEFRDDAGTEVFRVHFDQHFQELQNASDSPQAIHDAKLRGAKIAFTVLGDASLRLEGDIVDDTMRVSGKQGRNTRTFIGTRAQ